MPHTRTFHRALTIAGSDSGGGAGIQADLKTFSALGCYGMSVITALTAQNTVGVQAIHEVPASFVGQQIDSVAGDIGVDAVKIGMLHDPSIIESVADKIEQWKLPHVVVDPVMVAQSGDKLIKDDAIAALSDLLFPRSGIITPNLPEAEELLGRNIGDAEQMEEAAIKLLDWGPDAVLLKGGHGAARKSRDCFAYWPDAGSTVEIEWLEGEYIHTRNTHGTGCTLSSAIAASLARGLSMLDAVLTAKRYITGAIKAGSLYEIGEGSGPLHHFYQFWSDTALTND